MRIRLVFLALTLAIATAIGGEVTTLDNETIKCEIVSVTASEVTYKVGDKAVTKKIDQILKVDFRDPKKVPEDKAFSQIELTDGSILFVSKWSLKGPKLEATLLSGPQVTMPAEMITGILNNAKEEKYRNEFRNRVINTRGKEGVVVKRIVERKDKETGKMVPLKDENGKPVEVINSLLGTLGEGDPKGETIELSFELDGKLETLKTKQADVHGILFKNKLPPKAPSVTCRLLDTLQNVVVVSGVKASQGGGVIVTTPAGAEMEFAEDQIAQLDYTRGRLDYLSALLPAKTDITPSPFEKVDKWYVFKDNSLNMTPIKLGGTSYRQGLTLLPDVELEYALGGAYRQFSAVIGIDDETKAEGEGTLEIVADGKVIDSIPIVYKTELGKGGEPTKPARPVKKVALNIKDVEKLVIRFKAKDELNALSLSVSLGDAKVNK